MPFRVWLTKCERERQVLISLQSVHWSHCLSLQLWVGVLGPETDDISPDMRTAIEAQMETRESVPVWVSDADFSGCYDKFCHQVRSTEIP